MRHNEFDIDIPCYFMHGTDGQGNTVALYVWATSAFNACMIARDKGISVAISNVKPMYAMNGTHRYGHVLMARDPKED